MLDIQVNQVFLLLLNKSQALIYFCALDHCPIEIFFPPISLKSFKFSLIILTYFSFVGLLIIIG